MDATQALRAKRRRECFSGFTKKGHALTTDEKFTDLKQVWEEFFDLEKNAQKGDTDHVRMMLRKMLQDGRTQAPPRSAYEGRDLSNAEEVAFLQAYLEGLEKEVKAKRAKQNAAAAAQEVGDALMDQAERNKDELFVRHDETQELLRQVIATQQSNPAAMVSDDPLVRLHSKKIMTTSIREINKLNKKSTLKGRTCREKAGGAVYRIIDSMVNRDGQTFHALVEQQTFSRHQKVAATAQKRGAPAPQGTLDHTVVDEGTLKQDYELTDTFMKGVIVKFTADEKQGADAAYRAGFHGIVVESSPPEALQIKVEWTHAVEGGTQPRHVKMLVPRIHLEACGEGMTAEQIKNPHPHEWCGIEVKLLQAPAQMPHFAGLLGKIVDASKTKGNNLVRVRCYFQASHTDCMLPLPAGATWDEKAFGALFERSGACVNDRKPEAPKKQRAGQKSASKRGAKQQQRPAKRPLPSTAQDRKAHRAFVNALASDEQWKDVLKLVRKHLPYSKDSHTSANILPAVLRIATDAKDKAIEAYMATFGDEQGKVLAKKVMESSFLRTVVENPTKLHIAFQSFLQHLKDTASKQVPADQLQFEEIPVDEGSESGERFEQADDASESNSTLEVDSKENSTKRRHGT